MTRTTLATNRPPPDHSQRRIYLTAAIGLLLMAVLAPFAQFGVLQTLVVPDSPAATYNNIAAQTGLFQAAIAAFLIVAILDVVVAWAFYILLRPVNRTGALVVAWLRVIYGAIFALVLLNLVRAAQLVQGDGSAATAVSASIEAFNVSWDIALGIFGLHLLGLGALLFRWDAFPRILAALVVLAGAGYLADALGTILIAGYGLTISVVTFVGEAVLIVWLFWIAIKGRPATHAAPDARTTVITSAAEATG